MSQFYARYIPPSSKQGEIKSIAATDQVPSEKSSSTGPGTKAAGISSQGSEQKRKRIQQHDTTSRKHKKPKHDLSQKVEAALESQNNPHQLPHQTNRRLLDGENILGKYSVSKVAVSAGDDVQVRIRRKGAKNVEKGQSSIDQDKPGRAEGEQVSNDRPEQENNPEQGRQPEIPEWQNSASKHAGVLSKFAKSHAQAGKGQMEKPTQDQDLALKTSVGGLERNELHGLDPIPQPELQELPSEKPSYSTLPKWLAHPIIVPSKRDVLFDSLGLSAEAVTLLKEKGIRRPFPVQSTVIPLLCEGSQRHLGDLCISAATGSGKTLAYVLPLIDSLRNYVTTKLRGLIVVPTRELVKQVRATCDLCAAGTNIKIATALGSKSLADERNLLIEEEEVYDPSEYRQAQQKPVDWSTFSMEEMFEQFTSEDALDSVDFVKKFISKVDILICTPGRLVDHLRSTPGFNLDDVTWVIIDEADRLLNESYQEWIEVVMPALETKRSTEIRDKVLEHMRLEVPPRSIRKVACSATMTQDISKLKSLGLRDPRMVVLGSAVSPINAQSNQPVDSEKEPVPDADGIFRLPPTLAEYAIPVGDGADKPLFLLELLKTRIQASSKDARDHTGRADASSDSDNSSSPSESDSSSNSDSDADLSDSSLSSSTLRSSPAFGTPKKSASNSPLRFARALIFTRSSESATRLSRLLSLLEPTLSNQISTLTRSTTSSASSRKSLNSFLANKTSILIAADRASRGLDFPDLEHVVSYDVPTSASTYVHRVGRTARAGKKGSAWTLVAHREGKWFWDEIGKGTGIQRQDRVKRVNVDLEQAIKNDKGLRERYEAALAQLGEEVRGT